MSQHLKDLARHLVDNREGTPVAVSTIVAVFLNQGNMIPGDTREDQVVAARIALNTDEGLAYDPATDTYDTPNEGESAEDFAARRNNSKESTHA